jgi:hypothetical protein
VLAQETRPGERLMHRLAITLSLGLSLLALAAASAPAKEGFATLTKPPASLHAGQVWHPVWTVHAPRARLLHARAPRLLTIDPTGFVHVAVGTRTGTLGRWRFSVVFSRPGQWRYALTDGVNPGEYDFPAVRVAPET